jgi:hypothetical protein
MAKSKTLTLFPSQDQTISNISAEFTVTGGTYMLLVKGMKFGDVMLIEFQMGDLDCDPVWLPLVDCSGQVKLKYPNTFLILPIPLKYRAIMTDTAGLFMSDPSHFSNLIIQGINLNQPPVLQRFYHGCSGDGDVANSTPFGPNILPDLGHINDDGSVSNPNGSNDFFSGPNTLPDLGNIDDDGSVSNPGGGSDIPDLGFVGGDEIDPGSIPYGDQDFGFVGG